jgi:hypothetical protein
MASPALGDPADPVAFAGLIEDWRQPQGRADRLGMVVTATAKALPNAAASSLIVGAPVLIFIFT